MPLISNSSYDNHPFYIRNGHFETIIPSFLREIKGVEYARERINTPDDDFLDLDWLRAGNNKLIILSHGLEGSADRYYVKSMAKYFHQQGWDVLAWNYRSCSGEINRALRMYHHGVTDDYDTMLQHALKSNAYKKVVLSGFSMGGSTTLKYLGEKGLNIDPRILAAAVFSVPCNLWDSAVQLHGFKNAQDFYTSSTSDQFYDNIKIPALIVNAKNDPMLGNKCYPIDIAATHPFLHLEIPKYGGHVGFSLKGKEYSWMDVRAYEFVKVFLG